MLWPAWRFFGPERNSSGAFLDARGNKFARILWNNSLSKKNRNKNYPIQSWKNGQSQQVDKSWTPKFSMKLDKVEKVGTCWQIVEPKVQSKVEKLKKLETSGKKRSTPSPELCSIQSWRNGVEEVFCIGLSTLSEPISDFQNWFELWTGLWPSAWTLNSTSKTLAWTLTWALIFGADFELGFGLWIGLFLKLFLELCIGFRNSNSGLKSCTLVISLTHLNFYLEVYFFMTKISTS